MVFVYGIKDCSTHRTKKTRILACHGLEILYQGTLYLCILVVLTIVCVFLVCVYCTAPWDAYEACSSSHCHQLVLSCPDCRLRGLTTCCTTCQQNNNEQHPLEQCDCTQKRGRPISRTQTDLHTAGSSST